MARVVAYRIGLAILMLLAFWLLWSMMLERPIDDSLNPHRPE